MTENADPTTIITSARDFKGISINAHILNLKSDPISPYVHSCCSSSILQKKLLDRGFAQRGQE